MKFSDYIQKQGDEFRRAGDGYEALSDTSKACIDYAVQRFIDECAAKQQAIAFFKFCLPGPSDFEPHISKRYEQFTEQQNKDNESNTGRSLQ